MDDILNATLAGGVAIGAPSGVLVNPGVAVLFGVIAGTVSTLGYIKLTDKLFNTRGLHDTCGVNNLHGIPGILGAIFSALVIASYQIWPGFDKEYGKYFDPTAGSRSFIGQALIQLLCSLVTILIAAIFGAIAGFIMSSSYNFRNQEFYEDKEYFEVEEQETHH